MAPHFCFSPAPCCVVPPAQFLVGCWGFHEVPSWGTEDSLFGSPPQASLEHDSLLNWSTDNQPECLKTMNVRGISSPFPDSLLETRKAGHGGEKLPADTQEDLSLSHSLTSALCHRPCPVLSGHTMAALTSLLAPKVPTRQRSEETWPWAGLEEVPGRKSRSHVFLILLQEPRDLWDQRTLALLSEEWRLWAVHQWLRDVLWTSLTVCLLQMHYNKMPDSDLSIDGRFFLLLSSAYIFKLSGVMMLCKSIEVQHYSDSLRNPSKILFLC